MNLKRLTFYQLFIILILSIAIFLRLIQLGAAPLSDAEASWANQALQLLKSKTNLDLGSQPGYIMLTSLLFALFGPTNFIARLVPALAGSLLVLAPVFFIHKVEQDRILRNMLVILMLGLAIDPGMVTFSRLIGSPIMALSFTIIAFSAWFNRKLVLAGIAFGLALLSGPGFIHGILGIAVAAGISRLFQRSMAKVFDYRGEETGVSIHKKDDYFRGIGLVLGTAAGVILLVSTLFFQVPSGFAAWLEMFPEYFRGWASFSGVSAITLVIALLVYELFPFAFFLIGLGKGLGKQILSQPVHLLTFVVMITWIIGASLFVFVNPSRQVSDMIWILPPIWFIAAYAITVFLPDSKTTPQMVILSIAVFILLSLFWLTLSSLTYLIPNDPFGEMRGLVPVGIIILIGMLVALVGLGWNGTVAIRGLIWGLLAALFTYSLSASWGASVLRFNQPSEILNPLPGCGQAGLLLQTLDDFSIRNKGVRGYLDIISTVDAPSLRWALRHYNRTSYFTELPSDERSSVVITREEQDSPSLAAAYTGQDFAWWTYPGWVGPLPADRIRWWNYRSAPIANEKIILWIRTDLFPGGELQSGSTP